MLHTCTYMENEMTHPPIHTYPHTHMHTLCHFTMTTTKTQLSDRNAAVVAHRPHRFYCMLIVKLETARVSYTLVISL